MPSRIGSRIWPRIVIALAAAASIATTQLPAVWNANGGATLEPVVFDSQRMRASYAVHAEITGPGPYTDMAGMMTVHVKASQQGPYESTVTLRVTVRSTTNPGIESVEELTLPQITPDIWADVEAWTHCATPPCAEDFEVIVELIGTGAPALNITGEAGASASGDNYDLEKTTQLTVTASPLP